MVLSLAQREARRTRIGASEVAALPLIGAHPFTSPEAIYDRLAFGIAREASPNMLVGAALEPAVLALARQLLGLPVRGCSRAYVDPDRPLCASPDAYCGADELAEVKVTGNPWAAGILPPYVRWQVQTQLMLSGRARAHVIVLAGSSLTYSTLEADPEAFATIRQAVDDFVRRFLEPGVRPTPDPVLFRAK